MSTVKGDNIDAEASTSARGEHSRASSCSTQMQFPLLSPLNPNRIWNNQCKHRCLSANAFKCRKRYQRCRTVHVRKINILDKNAAASMNIMSALSKEQKLSVAHRQVERERHHGLNADIKQLCQSIPGWLPHDKESKVDRMVNIIRYICHLESYIGLVASSMRVNLNIEDLLLLPQLMHNQLTNILDPSDESEEISKKIRKQFLENLDHVNDCQYSFSDDEEAADGADQLCSTDEKY